MAKMYGKKNMEKGMRSLTDFEFNVQPKEKEVPTTNTQFSFGTEGKQTVK